MPGFFVLEAGALTTVQDLGRPGHAMYGVSASGAADPISLRMANRLVGNHEGAPGLEMTLLGGAFEFDAPALVAVTGSNFEPILVRGAHCCQVPLWSAIDVDKGTVLQLGSTRSGARCYLAVRGGIQVPRVFASASTHLLTGLGGFQGRPLQKGDRLELDSVTAGPPRRLCVAAAALEAILVRRTLRVTLGTQADWFTPGSIDDFFGQAYEVTEECDRMGLRLCGIALARASAKSMITEGVPLGAVQVLDNGQPIVLFVEHQTTGGYPKLANVILADLPAVGQLRPRDAVRFEKASLAEAHEILSEQEQRLGAALELP